MIEIEQPKIDTSKTRRPPTNIYRRNMYRHLTKRKRGSHGSHIGAVQAIYARTKD